MWTAVDYRKLLVINGFESMKGASESLIIPSETFIAIG